MDQYFLEQYSKLQYKQWLCNVVFRIRAPFFWCTLCNCGQHFSKFNKKWQINNGYKFPRQGAWVISISGWHLMLDARQKVGWKAFEKLEAFRGCCGLELNRSKIEALWLGKTRPPSTNLFNINWPMKRVCLGGSFSCDSEASTKDNFEKTSVALEKCLNVWSSRNLTL